MANLKVDYYRDMRQDNERHLNFGNEIAVS